MSKAQAVPEQFRAGFMAELDGRTAVAQDLRQRYEALTADLGGLAALSYQQRSLVERFLWLEHWLRTEEQRLAAGAEFDVGKWTQACNSAQGILAKLGLHRVARDVPDLAQYLKAKAAQ